MFWKFVISVLLLPSCLGLEIATASPTNESQMLLKSEELSSVGQTQADQDVVKSLPLIVAESNPTQEDLETERENLNNKQYHHYYKNHRCYYRRHRSHHRRYRYYHHRGYYPRYHHRRRYYHRSRYYQQGIYDPLYIHYRRYYQNRYRYDRHHRYYDY